MKIKLQVTIIAVLKVYGLPIICTDIDNWHSRLYAKIAIASAFF